MRRPPRCKGIPHFRHAGKVAREHKERRKGDDEPPVDAHGQAGVPCQSESSHARETNPARQHADNRSHTACKRTGRKCCLAPRCCRSGDFHPHGPPTHKGTRKPNEHRGQSKGRQHRTYEVDKPNAKESGEINVLRIAKRQQHAAEVCRQALEHKYGRHKVEPATRRQTGRRKGQEREQRHVVCHEHRGKSGHAYQRKHEQAHALACRHHTRRQHLDDSRGVEPSHRKQHARKLGKSAPIDIPHISGIRRHKHACQKRRHSRNGRHGMAAQKQDETGHRATRLSTGR